MKKGDRVRNKFDPTKGTGTIREVDANVADVLWDKFLSSTGPIGTVSDAYVPPSRWFISELELCNFIACGDCQHDIDVRGFDRGTLCNECLDQYISLYPTP